MNGVKVGTFGWYHVKIRIIFGVRFERQKVYKKANLHEKSLKSILIILSYTV